MKHTKRKLLSLLLTLAMLFSLMSAGMAASIYDPFGYGYGSSYDYSGYQSVGVTSGSSTTLTPTFPQYIMTAYGPAQLGDIVWDSVDNSSSITVTGNGSTATASAASGATNLTSTRATATAYYYLMNLPYAGVADTAVFYYDITVGIQTSAPVYNGGVGYPGVVPNPGTGTGSGTTSSALVTSMSPGSLTLAVGASGSLQVVPYSNVNIASVSWGSSNSSVVSVGGSSTSATVVGLASGTAQITAFVSGSYYTGSVWQNFVNTLSCTVTVGTGVTGTDLYISPATVQMNVGGYEALSVGSINPDLLSQLGSVVWFTSNPDVAAVYGAANGTTTGTSIYISGQSAGTATITAVLPSASGTHYTATCEVVVGNTSGADVVYSTTAGKSLTLNAADFKEFWTDSNPAGVLSHVVFGSPTGFVGSLKYSNSYNQQVSAIGQTFYAAPASALYDGINEVTFVPSTNTSAYAATGTLVVPFIAYGTSSSGSFATTQLSGQMYIMVTNGTVADINYQFSSTGVKLASADFTNVYKSTVSSVSAYPSYYIRFLDVPAFGSLYYNYTASSVYGQGYGTKLTKATIDSLSFGNGATSAYSIDALTYIPSTTSTTDTVRYLVYSSVSGDTPLYMGKVNFGKGAASANVVKYVSTVNKTVAFDSATFLKSSGNTNYVSFGTPSSGTLYKNSGALVSASDFFVAGSSQTNSLDRVYFVPKTGFTGVVEIPYTASGFTGSQISGTVKLYYSKTFTDVKADWAYDYIMQMAAEGIVTGKTSTTFDPDGKVTYGEALKMIMLATGYKQQANGTKHWADNYLALAKTKGLVSSTLTSGDLNKAIDRNAVASIAAKALGLKAVTGTTTPFADSNDGYVLALYKAGIVEGSKVGTKTYYYGSNDISRKEISKIICLISDYNG